MVAEYDRIRATDERADRLGECRAAGRVVFSSWNDAEEYLDFRQNAGWDVNAGYAEGRDVRRVTMDDGLNRWVVLVDFQVQENLAGSRSFAAELLAVHINRAKVVRLHESLADQCRRAKNDAFGKTAGDVAVVSGNELAGVDSPADFADFLPKRSFIGRPSCFASHGLSLGVAVIAISMGILPVFRFFYIEPMK